MNNKVPTTRKRTSTYNKKIIHIDSLKKDENSFSSSLFNDNTESAISISKEETVIEKNKNILF